MGNDLRLCFIGTMIGAKPGEVTTQGFVISRLFDAAGYQVVTSSSSLNRYRRLIEIIETVLRFRGPAFITIIEVYSGPSFVIEDIASWIAHCRGQRVVLWLHGGAMPEFMQRFPGWVRRVFSRADAIVTPSKYLARATAALGFEATIIPNVIDLREYPFRQRSWAKPALLWMRSFHPTWNPLMAVRVISKLRQSIPDATLVMAGKDKGFEDEAREAARLAGLDGAIHFSGFLDNEAKRAVAETADIFINTNRVDNMPVAVIEACAMGLPVVATAVGGVPDLLTSESTGLLVPDDDESAMVAAIRRLLDDGRLVQRLSTNGRELAERCSWESVRIAWESLFAKLSVRADVALS